MVNAIVEAHTVSIGIASRCPRFHLCQPVNSYLCQSSLLPNFPRHKHSPLLESGKILGKHLPRFCNDEKGQKESGSL